MLMNARALSVRGVSFLPWWSDLRKVIQKIHNLFLMSDTIVLLVVISFSIVKCFCNAGEMQV